MKSPLAVYLAVVVALLVATIAIGEPVGGALSVLLVLIGTTTFTVNVVRRRPQPTAAWWLVVAGAWIVIAQAVSVVVVHGFVENELVTRPVPLLLTAFPYPLLSAALALLARATARRGPVDALDATMVALAGFLLLWVFAIEKEFPLRAGTAAAVVALPATALVAFTLAARVAFGGGLRDPATGLLVLVVAVLLASTLGVFLLGLEFQALRTNGVTRLLWSTHGPLLGAIALLPSFTRPRRLRAETATSDVSTTRLAIFSVLVLVPLVAWAQSSLGAGEDSPMAVTVSLGVSALFLVTLVVRLALLARLAYRRADELRNRSADLASAVSEQQALQDQLRHQATHDPLTGLANRVVLTDRLTSLLQTEARAVGALLMVDLDGFKGINDTYGHVIGDELLRQVAQRLAAIAPPRATLARIGGDEFMMIVEDADRRTAGRIAQRVVAASREPYHVNGERIRMTASVGVLILTREQRPSSTEVLRGADAALYDAKKAGRNRSVVRGPS